MPGLEISEDAKCILLQVLRILRKEKGFGRPVGSVSNITRRFKLLTGYEKNRKSTKTFKTYEIKTKF